MVAYDLDGVLVSANGTVRAKTPELAAFSALGSGIGIFGDRQGQFGNVILDTDGELRLAVVVVYSNDLCRVAVL